MAIERQRHERGLKAALERQKMLVKEINHRVKNSLQLVAGLLNLQAAHDPEIGRLLRWASSRIMAIVAHTTNSTAARKSKISSLGLPVRYL
jgi:two-component sensor histidine kinase